MRTSRRKHQNRLGLILLTFTYLAQLLESLIRRTCYISYTFHALLHPIFFVLINILFHFLLGVPFWPNHFPPIWFRMVQFFFLFGLLDCLRPLLVH